MDKLGKYVCFGFDIGNYMSKMVGINQNIQDDFEYFTLPSFISFSEETNDIFFGKEAKERFHIEPQNTYFDIKKLCSFTKIYQIKKLYYFPNITRNTGENIITVCGSSSSYYYFKLLTKDFYTTNENGEILPLLLTHEQFIAMLFYGIKSKADNKALSTTNKCVITLSPCFYYAAREMIKYASSIANFDVVDVIGENIAAAIYYIYYSISKDNFSSTKASNIIVYDIGDYYSYISVINISNKDLRVLATDQIENAITGSSIDLFLFNKFNQELDEKYNYKISKNDIKNIHLNHKCKECKEYLFDPTNQNISEYEFCLPNFIDNEKETIDFHSKITRGEIEKFILSNRSQYTSPITDILKESKISINDISSFITLGQTSQIQIIQDIINESISPKHITTFPNIDINHIISTGAAVYCASKIKYKPSIYEIFDFNIHDVNTYNFGMGSRRDNVEILIPKCSTLPASSIWTRFCATNISHVSIPIFEGNDKQMSNCIKHSQCEFHFSTSKSEYKIPMYFRLEITQDKTVHPVGFATDSEPNESDIANKTPLKTTSDQFSRSEDEIQNMKKFHLDLTKKIESKFNFNDIVIRYLTQLNSILYKFTEEYTKTTHIKKEIIDKYKRTFYCFKNDNKYLTRNEYGKYIEEIHKEIRSIIHTYKLNKTLTSIILQAYDLNS